MQAESLVPSAPLVAHSSLFIDNDRRDAEQLQACSDVEPALTSSDDEDGGLDVLEVDLAPALLGPHAVVWHGVTQGTCALGKAFEALEVRVNDVRLPLARGSWDKAEYARSNADLRLEVEKALDPCKIGTELLESDGIEAQRELGEPRFSQSRSEEFCNFWLVLESPELPSQREHVSPECILE